MAKKKSVFEYDEIPIAEFDRSRPITIIAETSDGYYLILDTESIGCKLDPIYDDSPWSRGPAYQVSKHNNLLEFLKEEYCFQTDDEAIEWLHTSSDENEMNITGNVLKVTKISGVYTDPEKLFESVYGDEDNEDENDES